MKITRTDGALATFTTPASPDRPIALKRRGVPELLMEELRRLDEDDVYAATVRAMSAKPKKSASSSKTAARKS